MKICIVATKIFNGEHWLQILSKINQDLKEFKISQNNVLMNRVMNEGIQFWQGSLDFTEEEFTWELKIDK